MGSVSVVANYRWYDAVLVDPSDVGPVGEVEHVIRRYGQSYKHRSVSMFNEFVRDKNQSIELLAI